jgi:hypothetical protein
LTPYIAKILRTGKPLLIFDCFAGKGKFDGGEKGSPLIISDHIKNNLQKNPQLRDKIKGYFVEKKYYAELNNNLSGYPNISVLDGTFEGNLQNILSSDKSSNVFYMLTLTASKASISVTLIESKTKTSFLSKC